MRRRFVMTIDYQLPVYARCRTCKVLLNVTDATLNEDSDGLEIVVWVEACEYCPAHPPISNESL